MNATGNVTMTANGTGVVRGNSNNVGVGGMAGIGAGGGAAVLFFVLLFGAWSQMACVQAGEPCAEMCECLLACSRKGFWWVTRACALFRFWQGMPTDHLMKGVKAEKKGQAKEEAKAAAEEEGRFFDEQAWDDEYEATKGKMGREFARPGNYSVSSSVMPSRMNMQYEQDSELSQSSRHTETREPKTEREILREMQQVETRLKQLETSEREFGQASAKTKFQLPVPEQREVEGVRRNHGRDQQAARRIQEEINQLQLKLEKSIKRERARSNNLGPPGVNAWDRF